MRVVAGSAKGRRLVAPKGEATRPTSDYVREAVFNTLVSLDAGGFDGVRVLDLFAGTGALGIEALSRGAAHATFVEHDRRALATLRRNLEATGFTDQATVLTGDAARTPLPADVGLAFADPPYAFDAWEALLSRLEVPLAVLESDRDIDPPAPWRVLKIKRYGTTVVTLIRREE